MFNSCYFSRKRCNITPTAKCNGLLFNAFLLILSVIILTICTRNRIEKPGKESQACLGNLLDKREYHYAKETGGSYDNSRMISKLGSCHLLDYNFERTVDCIDTIYVRHNSDWDSSNILNPNNDSNKNLHFAFIGDSRIRQQFFNFLKVRKMSDEILNAVKCYLK